MLLLQDKLVSCAAGTNGCLELRRRAFAFDEAPCIFEVSCICTRILSITTKISKRWQWRASAEWSRCPGSKARRPKDSVAPLRRSSAGWMLARMRRLSACVGRRHPVAIRKASLMAGSIKRVWALRHQAGAQYSAVECTRAKVALHNVVAPAQSRCHEGAFVGLALPKKAPSPPNWNVKHCK